MSILNAMQATFHTYVQLALPASKDELSVPLVAHFALEPFSMPTVDSFKLSPAMMVTFVSVAQLLLNLSDALLSLCRTNAWWRCSINNLFSTPD